MNPRSMENRLRLAAQREGLRLEKSCARDRDDVTFGGYMLVNIERNEIAYGVAGHTGPAYRFSLEDVEAFLIKKALARNNGNARKAAEALGLSRSAFYRRLQQYGL